MKKYNISNYNKHICLKANGLMIVIILYLLKPYLMLAASIVYRGNNSVIDALYPNKIIVSLEAAAAIPVIFLLFAWLKRAPDATRMVRILCKNGKILIIATALLQMGAISSPLWLPSSAVMTRASWVQLIIYLLIITATTFSTYMRDCFADFPEHHQDDI